MNKIVYVEDPHDQVGLRCQAEENGFKCHRRLNHPKDTTVVKKLEDDSEVTVSFNHRTLAGGSYYTW